MRNRLSSDNALRNGMIVPRGTLSGKTIAVFRPGHQAEHFVQSLVSRGAEVLNIPALRIIPSDTPDRLQQAVVHRDQYDWIVFTSGNGVRAFVEAVTPFVSLRTVKASIAVIGPETARLVRNYDGVVSAMPKKFIAESFVEACGDLAHKKVLLPQAKRARTVIADGLAAVGAKVDAIVAYDVEPNASPEVLGALRSFPDDASPDFLTFTSSSSVEAVMKLLTMTDKLHWLSDSCRVAIGPITAQALQDAGYPPQLVADEFTAQGIVSSIESWVEQERIKEENGR